MELEEDHDRDEMPALFLRTCTRRGFLDIREDSVRRLIPLERSELHSNSVQQVPVIDRLGDKFADAQIHGRRSSHHIVSGGEQNNRD